MAVVTRAEVAISARNNLRPGLAAAAAELARFKRLSEQAQVRADGMKRMEAGAMAVRTAVGGIFAGSVLSGATAANKRYAEVGRAMTRVGITGDATAEQTSEGITQLRDLARTVAMPFDQMREGLDQITASGREFGDAMKMMPSVARTAQASGASVADIANSSTSLIDHMKISIEGLQAAQDTLAKGGQLGKFELKDMARYLPSMLPAFKALGYEGQEGLKRLVATLQVIRGGTGTAEEAAASANNIFQKMESDQTVKNFKEMGVDLPKALAKARKEGKDLIEVFTQLSEKALKGDMSKLPQLFQDMELARGMRAMLGGIEKRAQLLKDLGNSSGTIAANLARVTGDSQASLDRFSEAADRAKTAVGSLVTQLASPAMEDGATNLNNIAQAMERAAKTAREKGLGGAAAELANTALDALQRDYVAGRNAFEDKVRTGQDDDILEGLARRSGGPVVEDIDKTLDYLRSTPQTPQRREQITRLEAERTRRRSGVEPTEAELGALGRDQMRRSGMSTRQETPELPAWIKDVVEEAREARKNAAFRNVTSSPATPAQTRPVKNAPLPPRRPDDLSRGLPPALDLNTDQVSSDLEQASAKALSLKETLGQLREPVSIPGVATEGLEQASAKALSLKETLGQLREPVSIPGIATEGLEQANAKAVDVKSAVESIGPAGQQAGSQMAAGFLSGLMVMEAQADASIARIQGKLNGLRAPSLSFGGLNTGRSMSEIR